MRGLLRAIDPRSKPILPKGCMAMNIDNESLQSLYNERYKADYMDREGFPTWVQRNLGHRKVNDTLDLVPIIPTDILDYGCGVGNWLQMLSLRYTQANITGVDIADVAIQKCRSRFPKYHFQAFDGTKTSLANASFDLIFSFHVLEHVGRIEDSIAEIGRLLRPGGYACIIFPCGNPGSFQDWTMRLLKDGVESTSEGRIVFFFEKKDGHLRRMLSAETIALFKEKGMESVGEYYSGQFFGSMDWLCRSCVPAYIRNFFSGVPPKNQLAGLQVLAAKSLFMGINWLIRKKNLDTTVRRNPLKQLLVYAVKYLARFADEAVGNLAKMEWVLFKKTKNGSAQYLVFKKDFPN